MESHAQTEQRCVIFIYNRINICLSSARTFVKVNMPHAQPKIIYIPHCITCPLKTEPSIWCILIHEYVTG